MLKHLNSPVTGVAAPSMPIFYQFDWPEDLKWAELNFRSNDSYCSVIRVLPKVCNDHGTSGSVKHFNNPRETIQDALAHSTRSGAFQTATKLAGLSLTKMQYPDGVYIMADVGNDDRACDSSRELEKQNTAQGLYTGL